MAERTISEFADYCDEEKLKTIAADLRELEKTLRNGVTVKTSSHVSFVLDRETYDKMIGDHDGYQSVVDVQESEDT